MTEWGFSEVHRAHVVERGFGKVHDGTECGRVLWRKNLSANVHRRYLDFIHVAGSPAVVKEALPDTLQEI